MKVSFIKSVYSNAIESCRKTDRAFVIGYSFNTHDFESYNPLLESLKKKSIVVVSPDADEIVIRMKMNYPDIKWYSQNSTFKEWVENGFPDEKTLEVEIKD